MPFLAQLLPSSGPEGWMQYGVLGLLVVSIILGWLVPGRHHDRVSARADRLEEENDRLREHNEERVVPLLTRALEVLERSQRLDRRGDYRDRTEGP